MLEQALNYLRMGMAVFPVHSIVEGRCTCGNEACPDAGKHPKLENGVHGASCDPEIVKEWFKTPTNIGVATGQISGITVVDIDIADGKKGGENWAKLISEKGEPKTLMCITGSGGMHIYFKYNSAIKSGVNVLGQGIDIRNDGGYVVAPPSTHKSGNSYVWVDENEQLDHFPAWLLPKPKEKAKKGGKKKKIPLGACIGMLQYIPPEDRDVWRSVGIILGRQYGQSEEAWKAYVEWSDSYDGKKGRNHDKIMREAFYELSQKPGDLSIGSIIEWAKEGGWAPERGSISIDKFLYYAPGNNYIYRPTASHWLGAAVDATCSEVNEDGELMKPSEWLKLNRAITSMTRDPGIDGDVLKGHDCRQGEIIPEEGSCLYNAYQKPIIEMGNHEKAGPFLDHVRRVFNKEGDADQFLDYMAHRVQKPAEKPRFALLIAGGQGVGKDTAVEFCCPAIGAWNVANVDPSALDGNFNEHVAATLVRINEAANLQTSSKWAFNERVKVLIAGQPDHCTVNPKYGQKYSVRMHCGVIITTNHLDTGIYIEEDDRRYDVILAATFDEMGVQDRRAYFGDLWEWFHNGGDSHVAAYLHHRDIRGFNAATGQRKTTAHASAVGASRSSDDWLDDLLNEMGYPTFVSVEGLSELAEAKGYDRLKVAKRITACLPRQKYRLHRCGSDVRWKIDGKKYRVYSKEGTDKHEVPSLSFSAVF